MEDGILALMKRALLKLKSSIKRGRNYWALLKARTRVSRFSFVEKRIFDKKVESLLKRFIVWNLC